MQNWRALLRVDPMPALLAGGGNALRYYVRRDLLGEPGEPASLLWQLAAAQKILRKQRADGSWPHPGERRGTAVNYPLVETWRQFRFLVEMYGFTREEPHARRAAEFLFSCQTAEGDIRGFLANQYATYYTGAILSLLIKAGYEDDPRVERGLQWLLAMRQDDLGWSIPLITHRLSRERIHALTSQPAEPLPPDRSKPFSHNATGMVLRAFAAHSRHRSSEPARTAARLLASRFFQPDAYTSYQAASYWLRFEYPFWWNNLVAALDSVSLIGLAGEEPAIRQALAWLRDHQGESGLWRASYAQAEDRRARGGAVASWVSLAICRVMRRFYANSEHVDAAPAG